MTQLNRQRRIVTVVFAGALVLLVMGLLGACSGVTGDAGELDQRKTAFSSDKDAFNAAQTEFAQQVNDYNRTQLAATDAVLATARALFTATPTETPTPTP